MPGAAEPFLLSLEETDKRPAVIDDHHWHQYSAVLVNGSKTPAMSAMNGEAVGADTMRQTMRISAKPEDHVAYAQQYLDLGFDCLIYHSAGPDQRAFIEAYGREVIPRLRGLRDGFGRGARQEKELSGASG
jgi:hypothetical protein